MHLFTDGSGHCHGEGPDVSSAQVLPLPLVAEELELSFLFIIQTVAVSHLFNNNSSGQWCHEKVIMQRRKHTCTVSGDLFKLIVPHCRVEEADAGAVWCDTSLQDCSRMVLYPPAKSCNTDGPGMTIERETAVGLFWFFAFKIT